MESTLDAGGARTLQVPPGRSRPMTRRQFAAVAIASGALVLLAGAQIESVIITAVGATGTSSSGSVTWLPPSRSRP